MDLAMWITIAALLAASLLWIFLVRRIARLRSKAFVNSLRALNASLDREVQTLSRLDRSLIDWTTTMEQAARKLQAKGQRPSSAPDNDAVGPSAREHIPGFTNHDLMGHEVKWEPDEAFARKLTRLVRGWRNPELPYIELKRRIAGNYLYNYVTNPEGLIPHHFQRSGTSREGLKAIWFFKAQYFAGEETATIDSVVYAAQPKAVDFEVLNPAQYVGLQAIEKGWVMAIVERNAIRMHGAFGTGKAYWLASDYLSGKETDPKILSLGAIESPAPLRSH